MEAIKIRQGVQVDCPNCNSRLKLKAEDIKHYGSGDGVSDKYYIKCCVCRQLVRVNSQIPEEFKDTAKKNNPDLKFVEEMERRKNG